MGNNLESKRVFLIVSANKSTHEFFSRIISKHITKAVIYEAYDGSTGLSKMQNDPANVVITDFNLPKLNGPQFIDALLKNKEFHSLSILITDPPPEKELYLDELVIGRIQFLSDGQEESRVVAAITKALNFASHGEEAEFYLRFLASGEQLIKQGDQAESVYLVKKGRLRAYAGIGGSDTTLGFIESGEFVGEMAYINGEHRSANVEALSDCELIEVPIGTLERVLYHRPSWSKALMMTLSRRVKIANNLKATKVVRAE